MKLIKTISLVAGMAVAAFAAPAMAKTWECTAKPQQTGGWVPSQLIIKHNESTGEVTVMDNIIKHYFGTPQAGKVATDNGKRTTYSWKLNSIKNTAPGKPQFVGTFTFRATIMKGSNQLVVTSKPHGYRNTFRGEGACRAK
jgi:hypothetical protein